MACGHCTGQHSSVLKIQPLCPQCTAYCLPFKGCSSHVKVLNIYIEKFVFLFFLSFTPMCLGIKLSPFTDLTNHFYFPCFFFTLKFYHCKSILVTGMNVLTNLNLFITEPYKDDLSLYCKFLDLNEIFKLIWPFIELFLY